MTVARLAPALQPPRQHLQQAEHDAAAPSGTAGAARLFGVVHGAPARSQEAAHQGEQQRVALTDCCHQRGVALHQVGAALAQQLDGGTLLQRAERRQGAELQPLRSAVWQGARRDHCVDWPGLAQQGNQVVERLRGRAGTSVSAPGEGGHSSLTLRPRQDGLSVVQHHKQAAALCPARHAGHPALQQAPVAGGLGSLRTRGAARGAGTEGSCTPASLHTHMPSPTPW